MADPTPPAVTQPAVPTGIVGEIVADPDPVESEDTDSSYGDGPASSTASVSSSIYRYRQENGRTYHAYRDGKYVMPNDDPEQERLELQHHLFLLTQDNKLHLSPVGQDGKPVQRVLDVGTGTGLWAIDFADEHPEAQVIGVDLSPIQSDFVPPNCSFQIDDLEDEWTFSHNFDFIYSRMMTASFADWPGFFAKCYDHLAPGGWLELADIAPVTSDDGTMTEDTSIHKWVTTLLEGTRAIGRPFDGAVKYKEQLEAAGFVNVQQVLYKWPQNRWPKDPKMKELGAWTYEDITSGLHGLSVAVFTRVLGWSMEELEVLLSQVRKDMKNPAIHAYWPIFVVWGQKPE